MLNIFSRNKYPILKVGSTGEDVKTLQRILREKGFFKGEIGGNFYSLTESAVKRFQAAHNLTVDGVVGPQTWDELFKQTNQQSPVTIPPWYEYAKKHQGKKETDPQFNKEMSAKWSLFGMNLGTIKESWAAWCGLAVAVSLSAVGLDYAKDGALARNWGNYGVAIEWRTEGIPQGAIVWINHKSDCKSSSNNHVTMADGDCSPQDLNKSGATFNGYGGNQNNAWKVSTYAVKTICGVRWPNNAKYPKPNKVLVSKKCTSGSAGNESTR